MERSPMKPILLAAIILGEVITITSTDAHVSISVVKAQEVQYVKKTLSLEDFPCKPYPGMLFYYNTQGYLRCGEPDPN